jgi:hypothetical protein
MSEIDNINHIGMAVRDLGRTVARYEAMGFQLTPYSPHSGAWKPGEPVQSLGSGNRCVMFSQNYLEILASEDPAQPSPRIGTFLGRHEGAHIVCFNTETPSALDERLVRTGIETSGVIPLQRPIDANGGLKTAKFERVQFSVNDSPEGYIQAARHLTPEYIYQERYTQHENGCVSLSEAIIAVDDGFDGFVSRYSSYLEIDPQTRDGAAQFRLSAGTLLTIVSQKRAAQLIPASLFAPLPAIVAVAFKAPTLASVGQRLMQNGFTVTNVDNRLVVPAEQASGVAVIFGE